MTLSFETRDHSIFSSASAGDCRAAEQRNELAPLHSLMPPVLPAERIAHLGTAACCIHPLGRNEMTAITPPIIFSKEVAQKQATPFPRQASSPPEIVSDQISGDGAWMNFRFSRALPPGGLWLTPGREAFHPMDAAGPDHLFA